MIAEDILSYLMLKKQRIAYISATLDELYFQTEIPLQHSNPYTLLLAVLLSAQCTDARVNQVTPQLFALGDNPRAILAQSVEKIREIIKPCGLSQRKSQAIYDLSRLLVERHDAQVPRSLEELEQLPGVGHKTASVVMAQAFGFATFPVDTHIHRLAKRWRLSRAKNVVMTERDLKKCFPPQQWNRRHLQIIFYGREYCTARGCDGNTCRICSAVNCKK